MRLASIKDAVLVWGMVNKDSLSFFRKEKLIISSECRPYLYGLKHNVKIFKEEKIPCVYCTDNMLGHLFARGKIGHTVIFYKERVPEGFLCPAGSLYIFLLSKLHNTVVEFLKGDYNSAPVDKDAATIEGKRFIFEEDLSFVIPGQDEVIKEALVRRVK